MAMDANGKLALNGAMNRLHISIEAVNGATSLQHKQRLLAAAVKNADAVKALLKSL